jgi:hypothetical protein
MAMRHRQIFPFIFAFSPNCNFNGEIDVCKSLQTPRSCVGDEILAQPSQNGRLRRKLYFECRSVRTKTFRPIGAA